MKKIFFLILIELTAGCGKKSNNSERAEYKNVTSKTLLDGRVWMTENLDISIPGSFCQKDDAMLCRKYGRLYTWEAAVAGCQSLGEGWRLPTDQEWRNLANSCGGIVGDSPDQGKSAFVNLSEGGKSEFNALLGGNRERNGDFARLDDHGFYWTSSEYDSSEAWFYNFGKGSGLLNRHSGDKQRAASVRCIKD